MKKKFLISTLILMIYSSIFSINLYLCDLIQCDLDHLLEDKQIRVNYYNDDFALYSSETSIKGSKILEVDSWKIGYEYHIIWIDSNKNNNKYIKKLNDHSQIIYSEDSFMITKTKTGDLRYLFPSIHNGLVRIKNIQVKQNSKEYNLLNDSREEDPFIVSLLGQVNQDSLLATIQYLQDLGTRDWYEPESIIAQNWIKNKFENYGLSVDLMDITIDEEGLSKNVIATQIGDIYPEEYVVLGAHYDSISDTTQAPGADDNATGIAGILEIARIFSQYQFNRSIIFCAFSGEEYGLYGSSEYAQQASENEMEILGYVNIDMAGYLHPGDNIHTDMVAPESAQELVDFYINICSIYLPEFQIDFGTLVGCDSDHTSFNLNGYMGIFPFEDIQNRSPYIHSENDLIGPSMNSIEMVTVFTKATLATVSTLSNIYKAPDNFKAIPGDQLISLEWDHDIHSTSYNVYRDDINEVYANSNQNYFVDSEVSNGSSYTYYISGVNSEEESVLSNGVTVRPSPVVELPLYENFENSEANWLLQGLWNITDENSHSGILSLSDSPNSNYENNIQYNAYFKILNLDHYENLTLSFYLSSSLEDDCDYLYLESSINGYYWHIIDSYTGFSDGWNHYEYDLSEFSGEEFFQIRFRFETDYDNAYDGVYIDDMNIDAVLPNDDNLVVSSDLVIQNCYPNPFLINGSKQRSSMIFNYTLNCDTFLQVEIYNTKGQKVKSLVNDYFKKGDYLCEWDGLMDNNNKASSGIYFLKIKSNYQEISKKFIILK